MCQETPVSIIPRIVAVLLGETTPWTGNEILSRIAADESPCENHFDEALRLLLREKKLTSESDPWAPTLTSTTRCRLAYTLTPEFRAVSLIQPIPAAAPSTPQPAPAPSPAPEPVAPPQPPPVPSLPPPAVRREILGRLREEKIRLEREWTGRFGADCFRSGPPGFIKSLGEQIRIDGMIPRFRDALERGQGRPSPDFATHYQKLLQLHERDGTIPVLTLDSGVRLDPFHYVAIDLDRAERELGEGKEGSPANAREILAFLARRFDDASLNRYRPGTSPPIPVPAPAAEHADPLIGAVFGPYKVVALIGKGGMGAVYEAIDETLDRRVALKVLHAHFADNREYQERFLREARNAANAGLDHPNITQIYSAGRQGPHLWLAMQFVRGRTLARLLQERTKLPPVEALKIVRQIAEGLSVAHAAHMIHRDIKPENLMIVDSGRVKIMDFGLMRSVDVKKDGLTQNGLFVGTLEYASPEQCQDRPMDARTDLYSLGVVLYELLTGARPYSARNALGYLSMIPDPSQPPVPLRQRDPQLPAPLEAFVHRIIAKRPEERPASAEALISEIDRVMAGPATPVPVREPVEAPRKPGPPLSLWAGVLVAGLGIAAWLWFRGVPTAPSAGPETARDQEAGAARAAEMVSAFDAALPSDAAFELVGAAAWDGWTVDRADAPGGFAKVDPARGHYVLSAPSQKEQVRVLRKLKGAEKGYRIRWSFGPEASDGSAFMVAMSTARWVEVTPKGMTLFRTDADKVSAAGRAEFAERTSGGLLHVIPSAGHVLIYQDRRLMLAVPESDAALAGGLQLGMSGGSVVLESVRVLDRARD